MNRAGSMRAPIDVIASKIIKNPMAVAAVKINFAIFIYGFLKFGCFWVNTLLGNEPQKSITDLVLHCSFDFLLGTTIAEIKELVKDIAFGGVASEAYALRRNNPIALPLSSNNL